MKSKRLDTLIYTNKEIQYIKNRRIIEYDMKEAGWSICKELSLLTKEEIRRLSVLDKKNRHIQIGLISRDDQEFSRELNEGFKYFTSLFRKENKIEEDNVLSIKKDSLTVIDTDINKLSFGEVLFVPKAEYSSYCYISGIEFYANPSSNQTAYKNLNDTFGKGDLVQEIFTLMINAEFNKKDYSFKYLKDLRNLYLKRELDIGFYREVNAKASYRILSDSSINKIYIENIDESIIERVDITYNYLNILIPMIKVFS